VQFQQNYYAANFNKLLIFIDLKLKNGLMFNSCSLQGRKYNPGVARIYSKTPAHEGAIMLMYLAP